MLKATFYNPSKIKMKLIKSINHVHESETEYSSHLENNSMKMTIPSCANYLS